MAASHYELDRLTVIVDRNRLQQGATTRETNDLDPLDEKATAFGFAVVEVNGHDHGELLDVLSAVPFRPGKPTFVIAHTHKGHPISFMSNNVAWHHKVPSPEQLQQALDELEFTAQRRHDDTISDDRHLAQRSRIVDQPRFDCRNAYVETLADLAQTDHRIVGVVNDSVGSSKLDAFKKAFPDRLINVGIAEQDMVGVAAGLANGGRIPFVSAASCFLTARALEQIKADVAYSDRNVKLCGMSPGMAYGELGPTHHSIEDIAWLRAIDNMTIVVPADPIETAAALRWAAATDGPAFIRVSRMSVPEVYPDDYAFVPGRRHPPRGRRRHADQQRHRPVAGPGGRRAARRPRASPPACLDADGQAARRRRGRRRRRGDRRHRDRRGGHHGGRTGRRGRRDRRAASPRPGSRSSAYPSSPRPARPASCSTATACRPRASPTRLESSCAERPGLPPRRPDCLSDRRRQRDRPCDRRRSGRLRCGRRLLRPARTRPRRGVRRDRRTRSAVLAPSR